MLTAKKNSEALNKRLQDTIKNKDQMAAEIRAHYKSEQKRETLLRDAVDKGDLQTISAVLAAPSYLSGLTDTQHTNLQAQYYEIAQPELANQLAAIETALQTVTRALNILPNEFKKAGGS